MRLRMLLVGLAAVAITASSALAAPPADKGNKKPTQGDGCKPKITVVLKGTLASPATTTALSMNVTGTNRWGRAYKPTANVTLDDKTKVRGGGMKTVADLVADLKPGDRVLVQAKVCKADLKDPTAKPPLTARMVVGHPAKAEKDDAENDD